jgi:hypothetical protein
MLTEPIEVILIVVGIFNELGISYFITGSLATAAHGIARATMDVDIVADVSLKRIEQLVEALRFSFFVDDEMVRDAVLRRGSFNIIHRETMFKVDVFIPKDRPFDRVQFERRVAQTLSVESEESVYIASPEDNILAKLEWYRMGGEGSDRQWNDVLSVLRVQAERLDVSYLHGWASKLNVADLLERALDEAGMGSR